MGRKLRKTILFPLMAVLLFSTVASAEESSGITFRDIPWGSNATEVLNTLSEYEFDGEAEDYYDEDTTGLLTGARYTLDIGDGDVLYFCDSYDDIPVAGYESERTYLYFAFTPADDGTTTKEEEDTAFYGAQYIIYPIDFEGAVQDLQEKLTSLYGDPAEYVDGKNHYGDESNFAIWYDDAGAALSMNISSEENEEEHVEIDITYVYLEGDDWLMAADEANRVAEKAKEAEIYGNGDTSGL